MRFSEGNQVRVVRAVDLAPHTNVCVGETGIVAYVDPLSGWVDVKLDKHHKGLGEWDNCMWFIDGTEAAAHIEHATPKPALASYAKRAAIWLGLAVPVITFLTGTLATAGAATVEALSYVTDLWFAMF